jgi:hypothetical protein
LRPLAFTHQQFLISISQKPKFKHMKKLMNVILILLLIVTVFSCKKEETPRNTENYSSVDDFLTKNASPIQTHNIDAVSGGSFTTSAGTVVTVPENAFVAQSGSPVTGNVIIMFKDVYKKSDMLLNDLSTNWYSAGPIKSAGMFFIKATQGTTPVLIKQGSKITVKQPLNGQPLDTTMMALVLAESIDSVGWTFPPFDSFGSAWDSLFFTPTYYVYNLYHFSGALNSGTWCNSDAPDYFNAYPQTTLTLQPLESISTYSTEMFLLFDDVNAMVHVYSEDGNFPYHYAPLGLKCTAVAIGVKGGKLYAAFTPIVITENLSVNFPMTEMSTEAFMSQLESLN